MSEWGWDMSEDNGFGGRAPKSALAEENNRLREEKERLKKKIADKEEQLLHESYNLNKRGRKPIAVHLLTKEAEPWLALIVYRYGHLLPDDFAVDVSASLDKIRAFLNGENK